MTRARAASGAPPRAPVTSAAGASPASVAFRRIDATRAWAYWT